MSNYNRQQLKRKQLMSGESDQFFYSLHSIINQMIFDRKVCLFLIYF
jgi:hypothetical protein